jgi:hypothetical protein
MKILYRVLLGKPEMKEPLVTGKCICDDNNNIYLKEIRWNGVK